MKLKPCPFCGGKAKLWNNGRWEPVIDTGGAYVDCDIQSPDIYGVECEGCECQLIGFNSESEAIAAWNGRTEKWILRD